METKENVKFCCQKPAFSTKYMENDVRQKDISDFLATFKNIKINIILK